MSRKAQIKSLGNKHYFVVIQLQSSHEAEQLIYSLKEKIYEDDDYALTMLEKNKKDGKDQKSEESIGDDALVFRFQKHITIVLAKGSEQFDKLRKFIMSKSA